MIISRSLVIVFWAIGFCLCGSGFAGQIIAWGINDCGQCNVPDGNDFIAISAGVCHGLALKSDGRIVAWGGNGFGQCAVPDGNNFTAIAAGSFHNLALRSDGSLMAWGANDAGQLDVPAGEYIAISAGAYHNLALKFDGSLAAWGANYNGEINVPDGNDYVAVAAGRSFSLALKSDGSIVAWGDNEVGQLDVPDGNEFIAIAAGGKHGVALKADRSVVSWGAFDDTVVQPASKDFTAVAAGSNNCLALQSNGLIVSWGIDEDSQVDIPSDINNKLNNFIAIAAGDGFSLGIYHRRQRAEDQWYVSPDGSDYGDGSEENPWDLATALSSTLVQPGHTVWLAGGTYYGPFVKPAIPSGLENKPIIYRALPGQRVTLTADKMERIVLRNNANYVWFWGLEVTIDGSEELGLWGNAVKQDVGRGAKYINMVVHDCPNRSGFYVDGIGTEFYGCLSYRNGRWANGLSHGLYCQNRPDAFNGSLEDLPWMNFFNCIAFDNFGWGIHSYAEYDNMANMLYDGVIAFGNAVGDFISGGNGNDDNFVVRNCLTYFPNGKGTSTEFGYNSAFNGRLVVENSVFIGGECAVTLHNWQDLTFQNNTCYCPNGLLVDITTPETEFQYNLDNNRYYMDGSYLASLNGFDYRTLILWQQETGWDLGSINDAGEPKNVWVFFRPNKYEPDRAFLIIYNWPKAKTVSIALSKLWDVKKCGQYQYRLFSVDDIWGEPIAEGMIDDKYIKLELTGHYAPQFACYLVTRWIP
jgi:hypothetical protein